MTNHFALAAVFALFCFTAAAPAFVFTGLDVLQRDQYRQLHGRRIGIITNHTGVNREGTHIVELLTHAQGVTVVKLFAPEHGLYGVKDEHISDSVDEKSGLPVISLYGQTRTPSAEHLIDIDTLVFDMQDVGARYYTYIATMGNCMKAAAANNIKFVVLDRPNPVTGLIVDGPNPDAEHVGKFTCFGSFPVSHGMTIGELAKMFNAEYGINCDLEVIPLDRWTRNMWWEDTGLKWINPSPNMRSPTEAHLYLAIGLMEATNVSVGRGTDIPFECFGAPWIDGEKTAARLNEFKLPGLKFERFDFTPTNTPHKIHRDQKCGGVKVTITDRNAVKPVLSGLVMAWTLENLYGKEFNDEKMDGLLMNKGVWTKVKAMKDPRDAQGFWTSDVAKFAQVREKYLMYK